MQLIIYDIIQSDKNSKEFNDMKKNILWIIISLIFILLIILVGFITKYSTSSSDKDNKAYNTYTVRKETPISLEGKASPESVKTYNNNQSVGNFLSVSVQDGQTVKQGERIINYDTNGINANN